MPTIKTFNFNHDNFQLFSKELEHWNNWPVVYIIHDENELYVWQTKNVFLRSKQHILLEHRKKLKNIHVISDDTFNISATLDTESLLIQYLVADGKFKLQNGNYGLSNHLYYDKHKYLTKFQELWEMLREKQYSLATKSYLEIKNSDIFKYSPYKALTQDQFDTATELLEEIMLSEVWKTFLVSGKAWTWKTILAIYLMKRYVDNARNSNKNIALVVPMTWLRSTLKSVFRWVKWLSSSMVIGPSEVDRKDYDVLIVDEAHRLKQRTNIVNYDAYDKMNIKLWLPEEATELDWVMKCSKHQIFFYDKNQSIRPSDIHPDNFIDHKIISRELKTQVRVKGGLEYIEFIDNLLDGLPVKNKSFSEYEFTIYSDLWKMVSDIKAQNKEHWLCRVVAWYAWPWISRDNPNLRDIKIWEVELRWNSIIEWWVNSENAINEVGCIHTVQWYDLNYVWVIIWHEISYDFDKKEIVIKRENYKDANWYRGITDPEVLKNYIINIYKTLLVRWVLWCYVYIVDDNLREYIKSVLKN